ncbi:MAG: sulfate ABC transporter ATP-binding protein [Planctomycetes bacterium]|nr:sulfate ABC transporter ATP-binding protein [Planctomycetota bacterium]
MSIAVNGIVKCFGAFTALDRIDLEVKTGELVALLGPSGSGKTTLLRIIAGLEFADAGRVLFDGVDTTSRPVRDRNIGFVFQHYALFKHMTVFENVAFGLRVRPRKTRPTKSEIRDRVERLLALVQLEALRNRYPSQLSGGQRQRIALARALAVEPKVLLLDEPFGALDAKVRAELRAWLRRLHDEIHVTSVFVTHDQEEALEVADRVVVMNQGKIEQVGSPEEVYHRPASPFVYDFLGHVNIFHGRIEDGKVQIDASTEGSPSDKTEANASPRRIYVRPHLLDIDHVPGGNGTFRAKVRDIRAAGPVVRVELVSDWNQVVTVEISHERHLALSLKEGADVFIRPREGKVFHEDYAI